MALLTAATGSTSSPASATERLDPSDLTPDEVDPVVLDGLLASDDERDVRLGIELLAQAEHPALVAHLQRLTDDGHRAVRADALWRLGALDATRRRRRGPATPRRS